MSDLHRDNAAELLMRAVRWVARLLVGWALPTKRQAVGGAHPTEG